MAQREDFTERDLPVAPVLAVEVLSPSTRGIDLLLKKDRLERAGCSHYWVVDPDEPSITEEVFAVPEPFAVSLRPNELLTS